MATRLVIDGPTGSGKTYMLNHLKYEVPEWLFVAEPLSEWQNVKGSRLLGLEHKTENFFYTFAADPVNNYMAFETLTTVTKWNAARMASLAAKGLGKEFICFERCIDSDAIFMTMDHELKERPVHVGGILDLLMDAIFESDTNGDTKMDGMIYMHSDGKTLRDRIVSRGRDGELERGFIEYNKRLEEMYIRTCINLEIPWRLRDIPVLVVHSLDVADYARYIPFVLRWAARVRDNSAPKFTMLTWDTLLEGPIQYTAQTPQAGRTTIPWFPRIEK